MQPKYLKHAISYVFYLTLSLTARPALDTFLFNYLDMTLEPYFPGIAMRWLQSFNLSVVIKTYIHQ